MEKRIINPRGSQKENMENRSVSVLEVAGILHVSGQSAVKKRGESSTADMKTQLQLAIRNLEEVIIEAGYDCKNIVRFYVYTISTEALWPHFNIVLNWMGKHNLSQA